MAKVGKLMSTNVPRVRSSYTILEAANVMNREKMSRAAVVKAKKIVGLIMERALLWKFVPLNKRPDGSLQVKRPSSVLQDRSRRVNENCSEDNGRKQNH